VCPRRAFLGRCTTVPTTVARRVSSGVEGGGRSSCAVGFRWMRRNASKKFGSLIRRHCCQKSRHEIAGRIRVGHRLLMRKNAKNSSAANSTCPAYNERKSEPLGRVFDSTFSQVLSSLSSTKTDSVGRRQILVFAVDLPPRNRRGRLGRCVRHHSELLYDYTSAARATSAVCSVDNNQQLLVDTSN
jgi:hypothetical protein